MIIRICAGSFAARTRRSCLLLIATISVAGCVEPDEGLGDQAAAVRSDEPQRRGESERFALGEFHSCTLAGTQLRCWGDDSRGQIGDGSPLLDQHAPVPVVPVLDAIAITAGRYHTCGLDSGGHVFCWGDNGEGQLGAGYPTASNAPQLISGLNGVSKVVAGDYHTCALLHDGSVRCWGDNHEYQLGDGTPTDRHVPTPTTLSMIGRVVDLAAGANHTCALTSAGLVWCWGMTAAIGPTGTWGPHVAAWTGITAVGVTAGDVFSCALLQGGTVRCAGNNSNGELGNGLIAASAVPQTVIRMGFVSPPLADVVQLGSGSGHSCALRRDGAVFCWGRNDQGQLGRGYNSPRETRAAQVAGPVEGMQIAAGGFSSCARTRTGGAYCWGRNLDGQLGNGGTGPHPAPTPALIVGDPSTFLTFAAGSLHLLLVADDGTMQAGGGNSAGQLGTGGASTMVLDDAAVTGIDGVVSASAGDLHSCAVRFDGSLWCWGDNDQGELGIGSIGGSTSSPAPSVGIAHVTAVSAGDDHTCAVTLDGALYCFGDNGDWRLGTTAVSGSGTPLLVAGVTQALGVAAGRAHTCVREVDGTSHQGLHCFGDGASGQLGDGLFTDSASPVAPPLAAPALQVSAGWDHTCVLEETGVIECFGSDSWDQLGNGTAGATGLPQPVLSTQRFVAVSSGPLHSCAISNQGVLYCWGRNDASQLPGLTGTTIDRPSYTSITGVTRVVCGRGFTCWLDGAGPHCAGDLGP